MTTTIRPGSIPSGAGRGKFPITSQKSVQSAARLIGHAKGVSKKRVAKHIVAAAKAKGLKVPPSVKAKARGTVKLSNDVELGFRFRHGWIPIGGSGGDRKVSAKPVSHSEADIAKHGKVTYAEHGNEFDYDTVSMQHGGKDHYFRRNSSTDPAGQGPWHNGHTNQPVTHPDLKARLGTEVARKRKAGEDFLAAARKNGAARRAAEAAAKSPNYGTRGSDRAYAKKMLASTHGHANEAGDDTDLAGKWRHGWIPLDATAMLVKAKKFHGGPSGKSRIPSHSLPSGPGRTKKALAKDRIKGALPSGERSDHIYDRGAQYDALRAKSGEGRKSGVGTMKVKAKAPSKDTAAKQAARDEMTNRLDPKAPRHILSGELSGSQKAKDFKPGEHVTFHAGDAGQFRRGHIISASNSHVTIHSTHPTTGASEYHTYPTDHRGNLVPRPVEHNTLADKQYIAKEIAQHAQNVARTRAGDDQHRKPSKSLSEHFAGMKRMSPEAAKAAQKKAAESNVRFTQDAKDLAARINTSLENASAYSVTAEAMNRKGFAVGDRVALPTGSHTIVGLSKNGNMKLKHDTSGEIVRAPVGKARLVAKASERAKAATAK